MAYLKRWMPQGKKKMRPMFGATLATIMEQEGRSGAHELPHLISKTVAHMESKQGLKTEGIFRVPPSYTTVSELKKQFDATGDADLTGIDIYAVAGIFKQFLRELAEPPLTLELYDAFLEAQSYEAESARIEAVRDVVMQLPSINRTLVAEVLRFLLRVSSHSDVNLMSNENLAIVFGQNLLRPSGEEEFDMAKNIGHVNGVVLTLLNNYDDIFQRASENSASKEGGYTRTTHLRPLSEMNGGEPERHDWRVLASPPARDANSSMVSNATIPSPVPSPATQRNIDRYVNDAISSTLFSPSTPSSPATSRDENDMFGHDNPELEALDGEWGPQDIPRIEVECARLAEEIQTFDGRFYEKHHRKPRDDERGVINQTAVVLSGYVSLVQRLKQDWAPPPQQRMSPIRHHFDASRHISGGAIPLLDAYLRDPLVFAEQRLQEARIADYRPASALEMSTRELLAEKSAIKRELRAYDTAFETRYGSAPEKTDKEAMRPLYQRYRDIKAAYDSMETHARVPPAPPMRPSSPPRPEEAVEGVTVPPIDTSIPMEQNPTYLALKGEKRALQIHLHKYQTEFTAQTGRKVMYVNDREPVQREYQLYKTRKAQLVLIQEMYDKANHQRAHPDVSSRY